MPVALCGHTIRIGSRGYRGVCQRCYHKLAHDVKRGKVSWDDLEAARVCGPAADPKDHPFKREMMREAKQKPTRGD